MKKKLQSEFNSRQYMLSRDFEAFYYSDVNFSSVGIHSHNYYEIYFFSEGAVTMEILGKPYALRPGDVITVPPGASHRAIVKDPQKPYRRFVLWLSPELVESLQESSADYMYVFRKVAENGFVMHLDPGEFTVVKNKLFAILEEIHTERYGRETRLGLLVNEIILHLCRLSYEADNHGGVRDNASYFESITAFIEEHLEEELSLSRLSSQFYISPFYISHLFQENTGLPAHQYITKKRLAAAAGAIRDGSGITEAQTTAGFQDYSGFYRAFRKEYGMSPSEYKNRWKGDAER